MEESEKRKERLKAMRIEAAQAGGGSESSGMSSSHSLSNPLVESENASQYASPRFDYYTDPMAAFSGRRRPNISPQVSQAHYNPPPRPIYQGMNSPPPQVYQNPPPGPRMYQYPKPHFQHSPLPSPVEAPRPWGGPHRNPPPSWHGPHNTFNYGRGRGRSQGMSSGPGSSGGRGGSPRGPVSAERRPDLYYSKEMVEDPWKMLEPVIWKGVPGRDSDKHWLPKSIGMKKAKVSSESSQISVSQPSLAEYLAASFNDSINEEQGS